MAMIMVRWALLVHQAAVILLLEIQHLAMHATLTQSSSQPTVTGSVMQPVVSFARSSAYECTEDK